MIINPYQFGVAYDADALAYFTANTAITSTADKTAINSFFIGLKSDGVYSKMQGMWLPIWGSASTCKWNLINPQDTDAAFRLLFFGGITFASTGINSNGVNGYYNTKYNDNTHGSQNDQSMGVYIRYDINGSGGSQDIGTEYNTGGLLQIYSKVDIGGVQQYGSRLHDATFQGVSNSDSRGFYAISRTSSSSYLKQKNNSISTITQASTGKQNSEILGFKNVVNYTGREQAFSFLGKGLTNTEMSNFYSRVQTLMTYFGIQV